MKRRSAEGAGAAAGIGMAAAAKGVDEGAGAGDAKRQRMTTAQAVSLFRPMIVSVCTRRDARRAVFFSFRKKKGSALTILGPPFLYLFIFSLISRVYRYDDPPRSDRTYQESTSR